MKHLLLSLVLVLSAACREEIAGWDQLTDAEKDNIQERSSKKCRADNLSAYNKFKAESSKVFGSSSYEREDSFTFEFKEGSSIRADAEIIVWKNTASEIYFYVKEDDDSEQFFLKITKAENNEIIDDLLDDHCSTAKTYSGSTGDSSASLTFEFSKTNPPNTDNYKDTYTLGYSNLAYFAAFHLTRTKTTKNSDGDVVGSAKKYTSTFARGGDFNFSSDDYTNGYEQKFCTIAKEGSVYRFSANGNVRGFRLSCVLTTKPADWNLAIP